MSGNWLLRRVGRVKRRREKCVARRCEGAHVLMGVRGLSSEEQETEMI